jgi:hypothetical protein
MAKWPTNELPRGYQLGAGLDLNRQKKSDFKNCKTLKTK